MIRSLVAAAVGAGIVFGWSYVSWELLPWHQRTMHSFKNERSIAKTVWKEAKESGIYVLPNPYVIDRSTAEGARAHKRSMNLMKQGPFVFMSVYLNGIDEENMKTSMALSLLFYFIAALLVAWLLSDAIELSSGRRFKLVLLFVGFAIMVVQAQQWIWWKFSLEYTLLSAAELFVGWAIAGGAMVAIIRRS